MPTRAYLLLLPLAAAACDSTTAETEATGLYSVHLVMSDLMPLPDGYHYEGWAASAGGEEYSTGKFTADLEGKLLDLGGSPVLGGKFTGSVDLTEAAKFFVTIEPGGDADHAPSRTRLVAGTFAELRADLTVLEGIYASIGAATGTFILSTPTNGPDSNEDSGLWFINITGGIPARGLMVPFPLTGWNYHGWVSIDGITVTTGPILGPSTADGAAPHSGSLPGFSYPGEDFLEKAPDGLTFPTSVGAARVFVSLEPDPDPSPDPSYLVLFDGRVPGTPVVANNYTLANQASTFPSGRVRISD